MSINEGHMPFSFKRKNWLVKREMSDNVSKPENRNWWVREFKRKQLHVGQHTALLNIYTLEGHTVLSYSEHFRCAQLSKG